MSLLSRLALRLRWLRREDADSATALKDEATTCRFELDMQTHGQIWKRLADADHAPELHENNSMLRIQDGGCRPI